MGELDNRVINGQMLKHVRFESADRYGGVTIKGASLRSKLSNSYISDLESGCKTNVSIEVLQRLALAYHCWLDIRFIRIRSLGVRTQYDLLAEPVSEKREVE